MKLPSTGNFNTFRRPALELRTINLLTQRKIEYDFPIYSNYVGPRYYGLDYIGNSVKLEAFSGLRHIVALSNSINCNIQPAYH